jgi:hypothetical protein
MYTSHVQFHNPVHTPYAIVLGVTDPINPDPNQAGAIAADPTSNVGGTYPNPKWTNLPVGAGQRRFVVYWKKSDSGGWLVESWVFTVNT